MSATKRTYEFTDAEAEQLHSYLANREIEGWYYGNKSHFEQRHDRIKKELVRHALPLKSPETP